MMDSIPGIKELEDILICPMCSGNLTVKPNEIHCLNCNSNYPIYSDVALLARMGTSESWGQSARMEESSAAYQQEYRTIENAAEYNASYKHKFLKRLSTSKEFKLLHKLLTSHVRSNKILDLPCGGGRLSPQIAPFTDLIVEADIAEGQVLYGKKNLSINTPQIWITASAFHIPFRSNSFDGVVCCRLSHHLPTEDERERLLKELIRVSRNFVIFTFFDYHSLKNVLRRLRRPFNHKPPKMTMTVARVRELAHESGAQLVNYPALSRLSSGHRYALITKNSRINEYEKY